MKQQYPCAHDYVLLVRLCWVLKDCKHCGTEGSWNYYYFLGLASVLQKVENVVAKMVKDNAPETWPSCFRSLDTVIFTLEYMEKEDAFRKSEPNS
eukprot:4955164-Amphidinium_carterae.1